MKRTILILAIIFCTACTKEDDSPLNKLPAETQIGANTFGCLINGKLLIPRDGTGTFGAADNAVTLWGDPTDNDNYVEMDVRDFKSQRTSQILIHIQNLKKVKEGTYTIDESNGMSSIDGLMHNYIYCRVFDNKINQYRYYDSFLNSGVLNITKSDTINEIISGNFYCKVIDYREVNDTIEIKNGRFDFNGETIFKTKFP